MTTITRPSLLSSVTYRALAAILPSILPLAKRLDLIKDYALDWSAPVSGLHQFAHWKVDGEWFFWIDDLTIIILPKRAARSGNGEQIH